MKKLINGHSDLRGGGGGKGVQAYNSGNFDFEI